MKHKYSLVHLTCISSAPPEFIRTAAAAGYDYVSLRTISMQLPNEIPHYLTDPVLREETRAASKETGVQINDTENARIYDGVDVREYEPHLAAAAELGIRHILCNIWTDNRAFYTQQFGELCRLAAKIRPGRERGICHLGQREGPPAGGPVAAGGGPAQRGDRGGRAAFPPLPRTAPGAGGPAQGVVPFHAPVRYGQRDPHRPQDPGPRRPGGTAVSREGAVDLKGILSKLPEEIVRGIEVPHSKRLQEAGFEAHARRALEYAKQCLE